jgi:hypothetical protein
MNSLRQKIQNKWDNAKPLLEARTYSLSGKAYEIKNASSLDRAFQLLCDYANRTYHSNAFDDYVGLLSHFRSTLHNPKFSDHANNRYHTKAVINTLLNYVDVYPESDLKQTDKIKSLLNILHNQLEETQHPLNPEGMLSAIIDVIEDETNTYVFTDRYVKADACGVQQPNSTDDTPLLLSTATFFRHSKARPVMTPTGEHMTAEQVDAMPNPVARSVFYNADLRGEALTEDAATALRGLRAPAA